MRWAAICALAVVSGCSWGGDDEPVRGGGATGEIEQVVHQLDLATRAGDGRTVCEDLLTPEARARLGGRRCEGRAKRALAGLEEPRVELARLRVRTGGREAVALVRTRQEGRRALEETLVLTRTDGEWRFEALRR
jgi:hypothetical protein